MKFKLVVLSLFSALTVSYASSADSLTGNNEPVLYMLCLADDIEKQTELIEKMGERALAWRAVNSNTPILCIHNSDTFPDEGPQNNIQYQNFNKMITGDQLNYDNPLKIQNPNNWHMRSILYKRLTCELFFSEGVNTKAKANIHFRCDAARTILALLHMNTFPNRGMMYVDLSIQAIAISPLFTKYAGDLNKWGIVFASGFLNTVSDDFYREIAKVIAGKRIVRKLKPGLNCDVSSAALRCVNAAFSSNKELQLSDEDLEFRNSLKIMRFMRVPNPIAENSAFIVKPENEFFQSVFFNTLNVIGQLIDKRKSSAILSTNTFSLDAPQHFYNLLTTNLSVLMLKKFSFFLDIDEHNPLIGGVPTTVASIQHLKLFNGFGEAVSINQDKAEQVVLNFLQPHLGAEYKKYKEKFKDALSCLAFPVMDEPLLTRPSQFAQEQSEPVLIGIDDGSNMLVFLKK